LRAGEVDAVGPEIGDIHRVSNGLAHGVSVSIHVYGGNIGAQSLINAGLANRVYALRNGTIGWTLAGLSLKTGQQRQAPPASPAAAAQARARARQVAARAGVKHITPRELDALRRDKTRTLYEIEVRGPEGRYRRPYEGTDNKAVAMQAIWTGSLAWSSNWRATERMGFL